MTAIMLLRIAWRNLWRHPRRTVLTALAFSVGVLLLIVFLGLSDGMHQKMIETGVRLASGHVVVEPEGARDQAGTDVIMTRESAEAVRRVLAMTPVAERVRGSAPRLLVSGLLTSANNSTGVQVIGAVPEREEKFSLLPDRIVAGSFLGPDGRTPPIVVGKVLAEKLKVDLGSKVVLMMQSGKEIQSQLLRVRGIFATGMSDVDGHVVTVSLHDLQAWLDRPGALSHQAIFLQRAEDAEPVRRRIAEALGERPVSVLTWRQALPQLDQFIRIDDAGNYIFNGVVLVMVTLGVLNTILMAVLERRREFGLLAALGLRPVLVALMVTAEGLLLTVLGGGIGLAAGLGLHRYFARAGLDMAALGSAEFSVAGVTVDTVIYSYLYAGRIRWSLIFIAGLGVLAVLYPALRAARTAPTEATRGL